MTRKRLYISTLVIAVCSVAAMLLFAVTMERRQSRYAYERTNRVLRSEDLLGEYGFEEDDFLYVPAVAGMAGIIIIACAGVTAAALRCVKYENQKVEEMGRYCEDILEGNYAMDLRDNEEGELSILKNKVYDITVMLREQNQHLNEGNRAMERMIADISHQLKTPVTSLNMINEILYLDLPEEKKIEFLDNMQKDLLKIEWLVKTILNMAKVDSGTLVMERKDVSAAVFSEEIRKHFHVFCEMSGSRIAVSGGEGISFPCDVKWTREAVNNIVKNAIEHGAKNVTLNWEQNNLYTKLKIGDDGEGIEKEEIPHIFDRFYRTKNSRDDSMGLGLAFTKSIIEYQDGEIKVQSKKGAGSRFIIKLYKNLP